MLYRECYIEILSLSPILKSFSDFSTDYNFKNYNLGL